MGQWRRRPMMQPLLLQLWPLLRSLAMSQDNSSAPPPSASPPCRPWKSVVDSGHPEPLHGIPMLSSHKISSILSRVATHSLLLCSSSPSFCPHENSSLYVGAGGISAISSSVPQGSVSVDLGPLQVSWTAPQMPSALEGISLKNLI